MADTLNKWHVARAGQAVVIMRPPRGALTKDEALVLAAWLVTMSGKSREEFNQILASVEAT